MRWIAPIVLAAASSACASKMPLEVSCTAGPLQQALCSVKSTAGAQFSARTDVGPLDVAELEAGDGGVALRLNLIDVPLGAKTVIFEASDRQKKHKPGTATWPISFPVRYELSASVGTNARAAFHFTLPAGAKVTFDGADLAPNSDGTADASVDLLGDLTVSDLHYYEGHDIPFIVSGPSGASSRETVRVAAPDEVVRDVREAFRHKGVPLPFAAAFASGAGPRPLAYVHEDKIDAKNGFSRLRDLELVAFDGDENDEQLDSCEGVYMVHGQMAVVTRWRNIRPVEVYEARTGTLVAQKTFRGSTPRQCRETESIQTIDGMATSGTIFGGPVDDAAVEAWLAALPAFSSSAPKKR